MPTVKPPKRLERAPLTTQNYMDRIRAVWTKAQELKDEDTLVMVRRRLTGTFKITMKDNSLEFDFMPTFKDDQLAIRDSFANKVTNLEKTFKKMSNDVLAMRQAPGQTNRERNAAAK
ncbi:MAG: hypothetical protein WC813_01365 [Patescibacteria group bacterium]|jgi:hypothetical protein